MSLKNYLKPWSDADLDFLRGNYPKYGKKKCAEVLCRTEVAVKEKAKRLKVRFKEFEHWDKETTRKLIEIYPTTENRKIAEILGLPVQRVKARASYLKLRKTPEFMEAKQYKNQWTDQELAILEEMYPDHPTKNIPLGRTVSAIYAKAEKMGLKKRWAR